MGYAHRFAITCGAAVLKKGVFAAVLTTSQILSSSVNM